MAETTTPSQPATNFIRNIIDADLEAGKHKHIVTRFPPEPNGYLHIGHAAAAHLNFSLAQSYPGSRCHLRFDDTNPEKEDMKFVEAIQEDLKWLGCDWGEHLYFASDYFDKLYAIAIELIKNDKAFVCDLSFDDIQKYRGTLTEPGTPSPYRNRTVAENLELLADMKAGKCPTGSRVLRAKIDMASGNMHMRDPILYRIKFAHHPRTGDAWNIYPSYDFTHCLSDALEEITHSLCSIEFQDHRPLYDWVVEMANMPHTPRQYEFTRLNLQYTVTSKRKLKQLVDEQHVAGWDDPRMPTLAGMRARGYPPEAIKDFCTMMGVSRRESVTDFSILEECVRQRLNDTAPRAMAVVEPLKIVLTNWNEQEIQELSIDRHPKDPGFGKRQIPFGKELYIDRADFAEEPPPKYFRLAPGKEVRLRGSYVIKCEKVLKDTDGVITELHCSYDNKTLGCKPEGRKVKGVIHWVPAEQSREVMIYEYDRLFAVQAPEADLPEGKDFTYHINPKSLITHTKARVEPSVAQSQEGELFQFERLGYFVARYHGDTLNYYKVVSLKDSWAKEQKKG